MSVDSETHAGEATLPPPPGRCAVCCEDERLLWTDLKQPDGSIRRIAVCGDCNAELISSAAEHRA